MMYLPKLVKNNDKYYSVIRTIADNQEIDYRYIKHKLNVEYVFRAQGKYWFVNEVEEAQIVPDLQYKLEFEN